MAQDGFDDGRRKPQRPARIDPEEAVGAGRRSLLQSVSASPIWKLAVTWSIMTIIAVQLIKLVASDFRFFANPGPTLAITFIAAWFFRRPPSFAPQWLIQPGSMALQGIFRRVWGIISFIWTICILIFLFQLFTTWSQNQSMPFGSVFIFTLENFFAGMRAFLGSLLWYFRG